MLRATSSLFLLVCLVGLGATPADAGGRGKKSRQADEPTEPIVVESTTTDADAETTEAATIEYDGTLDPTSVPIVSTDLFAMSTVTEVDVALETEQVHQVATGRDVVVAVLDGGFTRPDKEMSRRFSSQGYDAVDRDWDPIDSGNGIDDDRDGCVDNALGHGTFVADMILKVAPDATIIPIRVADDEGRTMEQWVYDGVAHAIESGAHVINLSLELKVLSDGMAKMLWRAAMEGIIIVVSAGNGSDAALGALADSGMTLAVGAVDSTDTIATFSNFETNLQWYEFDTMVFAPGVNLLGTCGFPRRDSTCIWSGTSFATGIVSGAVALELEQVGTSFTMFVSATVRSCVDPVYTRAGEKVERAGRINLRKLVGLESAYESSEPPSDDKTTDLTYSTETVYER